MGPKPFLYDNVYITVTKEAR